MVCNSLVISSGDIVMFFRPLVHENQSGDQIKTGFVRRTNYIRTKGFGFVTIEPDIGDEDIFFHIKGAGNEV